jgi:RNA polymerase sigma-70 factor (ECF subfamily)
LSETSFFERISGKRWPELRPEFPSFASDSFKVRPMHSGAETAIRQHGVMPDRGSTPCENPDARFGNLAAVRERPEAGVLAQDREDQHLVEQACNGDRAAVARLITRLLPSVRSVMRNRLRGAAGTADLAALVDDGLQELFLRLFADEGRILRRWSPGAGLPLQRYVALVADRLAVSLIRTWRRGLDHGQLHEIAETLATTDPSPEQWLQSRQALALLFDALTARLSPLGRRLFELLFVEEQDTESICDATGISADSVYAWRSRLRRRALELIELVDQEYDPRENR